MTNTLEYSINLNVLSPLLISEWRDITANNAYYNLVELIDQNTILTMNGSMVNRLFRESNVPNSMKDIILSFRFSKKKAIDKRNQRARNKNELYHLSDQLEKLQHNKQKLVNEKSKLIQEIVSLKAETF